MNNKVLFEVILALSREIQQGNRAYYYARIIEFLTDIMRNDYDPKLVDVFLNWVDKDDRTSYELMFFKAKLSYQKPIITTQEQL